jgi:hypothetical protein
MADPDLISDLATQLDVALRKLDLVRAALHMQPSNQFETMGDMAQKLHRIGEIVR